MSDFARYVITEAEINQGSVWYVSPLKYDDYSKCKKKYPFPLTDAQHILIDRCRNVHERFKLQCLTKIF